MASTIRIRRSSTDNPPVGGFATGELGYTFGSGGRKLYIGGVNVDLNGTGGSPIAVGGEYFTEMLDHTKGTLTASSAIITNSDNEVDVLKTFNLQIGGSGTENTIQSTDTGGSITILANGSGAINLESDVIKIGDSNNNVTLTTNGTGDLILNTNSGNNSGSITIADGADANISITPNGTGKISLDGQLWPNAAGTNGFYLKTDNSGVLEWAAIPSGTITLAADTGTPDTYTTGETLTFTGTDPVNTAVTDNTITISVSDATTTTKGIASFSSTNFSVASGAVSINDEYVQDTVGSMVSSNTETNISVTYDDDNGKLDFSVATATESVLGVASFATADFTVTAGAVTIKNVNLGTQTTGDYVSTITQGTGITVTGGTGEGSTPTIAVDTTTIATKAYVDAVKTGLDVKDSVRLATIAELTATYDNGTDGVGATLTNSGTQAALTIDSVPVVEGDRILVKNQGTTLQNGIYTVTTVGTVSTNWVLTRATDFDQDAEVTGGAFTFVEAGTVNQDNGFVMTANGTIDVGTDSITWVQFSGAGQIIDGDGLSKSGNTLSVNVDNTTIEISGDNLRVKDAGIIYAKIQNVDALSVIGRASNTAGVADEITSGAAYNVLRANSDNTAIGFGSIDLSQSGAVGSSVLGATNGGTGLNTYASGDIIYASASNTLSALPKSTDGKFLYLASGFPAWTDTIDGGIWT
jgi:hypothetical protein